MRTVLVLTAALTLSGCMAVQHNTASGRPEVVVAAPVAEVKTGFVNAMVNRGYTIKEDTPYQLVMDRPSTSAMANVLLGSTWNPQVHSRVAFTIAPAGDVTRVVADMTYVANPGTAFERLTPMSDSKSSLAFQTEMAAIQAQIETGDPAQAFAAPPRPPARPAAIQPVGRQG